MQGLIPALLAREIPLCLGCLKPGATLGFLSVCVAQACNAFYELIEWWVALLSALLSATGLACLQDRQIGWQAKSGAAG